MAEYDSLDALNDNIAQQIIYEKMIDFMQNEMIKLKADEQSIKETLGIENKDIV